MPTIISVTLRLSVPALLDISDPDFAHWYSHGVFWAMYGDYQGDGPQPDRYLIDNITRDIGNGWFNDLSSGSFPHLGFYLGMIHGGIIDPESRSLRPLDYIVTMTDADFHKGYMEGLAAPRLSTDYTFVEAVHALAISHPSNRVLACELGKLIGALSRTIIPSALLTA